MAYGTPWTTDSFNGMPYRFLGNSGLRVSNVGLGTWKFGFPETGDGARVDRVMGLKMLDEALQAGVTFWDTANRYNNASGNSERIIGEWFENNPDQRRNIVLATKIFGGMDGVSPNHSRLSRMNIFDAVGACLERLQVDYIDLLYFHAYDPVIPVEESLCAVEDLIKGDMVRYFAVSNYNPAQLSLYREEALKISPRCKVLAVQNQFDILNGETAPQKGTLDYCAQTGISYIAWSPLARGLLTGKYLDRDKVGEGDRLYDEGDQALYEDDATYEKVRKLNELAGQSGYEMSQLVLAYMLTLEGMGPVIPSASNLEQLKSNAQSGKIVLSDDLKGEIKGLLG